MIFSDDSSVSPPSKWNIHHRLLPLLSPPVIYVFLRLLPADLPDEIMTSCPPPQNARGLPRFLSRQMFLDLCYFPPPLGLFCVYLVTPTSAVPPSYGDYVEAFTLCLGRAYASSHVFPIPSLDLWKSYFPRSLFSVPFKFNAL